MSAPLQTALLSRSSPHQSTAPAPVNKPALRLRLILLVVGSMFPLALLSAAITWQNYQGAKSAASARVLQSARNAIAASDRELQYLTAGLEVLAASPALHAGDLDKFRLEAERFAQRYGKDNAVVLADASGQQVLNTFVAKGAPLPKRAEVESVRAIFATKKPQLSTMHMGSVIPQALFTVDVPVLRDDEVIYDLSFNPPRQIFYDIIGALGVPEDWIVSIVDKKLQHVARRLALQGQGVTQPAESLRIEMAKTREGIAPTVSLEGISLITAFTTSDISGWAVAIGIPAETIAAPARFAIYFTVGVGAILMLIGLWFALRLARQLATAEADRELLMNELNHRVKNTLSSVQAIVQRTLRNDAVPDITRKAVESRLLALSHAHNSLSAASWSDADLREIASAILSPYLDPSKSRAQLSGPDVRLQPRVAIALAMVLNELITNAAKYGALSVPGGQVQLSWTPLEGRILRLEWQERGGPPVQPPSRTGFGTQFIQRAVTQELGGAAEALYLPTGLTWVMELPL